jgi:hypothetical protein
MPLGLAALHPLDALVFDCHADAAVGDDRRAEVVVRAAEAENQVADDNS